MVRKKNGLILMTALTLFSIVISGCKQSYSPIPKGTPGVLPTNLFVSPLPTSKDFVGDLFTQTALAQQALKTTGTPGTPVAPGTPGTAANTPAGTLQSTATPGSPVPPTVAGTVVIGTVTVGRPSTYVLHQGEFPYCIARRFNVNPDELIKLNPTSGKLYPTGFTLKIPQTGNPFPANRSLHKHPATYTVSSASETIYGVACYYGDVDPMAIAQANNIGAPYKLKAGQVLKIP